MSQRKPKEMIFRVVYLTLIFYVVFSFHRLITSAACFLVVFNHFRICKTVAVLHMIETSTTKHNCKRVILKKT